MLALFIAVAGTAYAIGRDEVKSRNIAPDAVTNKHTKLFEYQRTRRVDATVLASVNDAQVAAPEVPLGERGLFSLYGKCFGGDADRVFAIVYIRLKSGSAVMVSPRDSLKGDVIGAGEELDVLRPDTADFNREVLLVPGEVDNADVNRGTFFASTRETSIIGHVGAGAIGPSPGNGDPLAPWSRRSRCIFSASLTGG